MRPFLLISLRDDVVAATELADILRAGRLQPDQVVQLRLNLAPLPEVDLDDYSGIILGGSPYNASDPDEIKSQTQHRVEADLHRLLDEVIERDFPFLGLCYGVGTLGRHQGGVVDRTYGEDVEAITVTLTPEGTEDQLAGAMPASFDAFVGHKEGLTLLPATGVLLATGENAPNQLFRVGRNVYASQFHPELNAEALTARMERYRGHGYFHDDDLDDIKARAHEADVSHSPLLLQRFVELFAR